jgi:hypothetical protein
MVSSDLLHDDSVSDAHPLVWPFSASWLAYPVG